MGAEVWVSERQRVFVRSAAGGVLSRNTACITAVSAADQKKKTSSIKSPGNGSLSGLQSAYSNEKP